MSSKNENKFLNRLHNLGFASGSIASYLASWFTLLSVSLIIFVSATLYVVMEDRMRETDDRLLSSMVNELHDYLKDYRYDNQIFQNELRHEVESFDGLHVLVVDMNGNVVAEAPADIYGLNNRLSHSLHESWENNVGKDWTSDKGDSYRLIQRKISTPGGDYILCVGMNRTEEEGALTASFWLTLLVATLCAVVLAIVLGRLIAKRSTQPIRRMASFVSSIRVEDLHRRVSDETWPQELKPLAESFDQLMSRLEISFGHIEQFSSDIAHEFRTSLHILRGEAEMTLMATRNHDQYRTCIESATEEYQRLSQMVESLLLLARMDQPDALLNRESLDAAKEIASVCDFFQALAEDENIILEFAGAGSIYADDHLLRRALSNLITNALRYTPSGGRVVVEIKACVDGVVQISVTDTGIGIADDQLMRVFDRFYRCDKARSRQDRRGFGLGLAIVKSIMNLHGGVVVIHSELGRGTCVTLKFPSLAMLMYNGPRRRKNDYIVQLEQVA
jgi:two-component system heavy metal sensor histidine kinase CusS